MQVKVAIQDNLRSPEHDDQKIQDSRTSPFIITYHRKLFQGCSIKANRNICMNLSDGWGMSAQYGEGEEAWRNNKRGEKDCHKCHNSTTA